jgi:hypothetical protein
MSTTVEQPPEVAAYLAVVRTKLGDLPAAERDDLLAEVEASMVEAAAEGGSISARLGPPEEFAAELRNAAGLHEATGATATPFTRTRELLARLDARFAPLLPLGRDLAPIWWVARGYLAVGLVAYATDASWSTTNHAIPRFGNGQVGLLAILASVALSVWLGLRTRGRRIALSPLLLAANAVLIFAAIPVVRAVTDDSERRALLAAAYAPRSAAIPGLAVDGVPVDNIYPFSREGHLLQDVLLYDGAGRPLAVRAGSDDPNRRLLKTTGRKPVFNSFPIRYYEPGTNLVAKPHAMPQLTRPTILTSKLPAP